jgi:hypothetical protein
VVGQLSRLAVLILLCLAVAASATVGVVSATTSSVGCVYKLNGFPVWIKVVAAGSACNAFGTSAKGSAVRIFTDVVGPTRCAFQGPSGALLSVHAPSSMYGSIACSSLSKMSGWTKL